MSRIPSLLWSLPAVAPLVLGAGLTGCGRADSDRAAREKLDQAYAYRAAGESGTTHVTLANEVAQSQSGDVTLALAHELVGDVSVDQAAAVVAGQGREPEPGLGALQTRAIIIAEQANRLATALALSRAYVATEQQRDPRALLEAVEAALTSVRTGESWSPGPEIEGQLPALEATQKRIDGLNDQLAGLNTQITQLEQQRTELLNQASEVDQQSDREQGQQSVDTYRRAADMRTEAAEVAASTERLRAQVRQATAELEQAQALRGALEQAVSTLEAQRDGLNQRWTDVQGQIGQINEAAEATFASAQMAASGANPQSSLELMAMELAPALSDMAQQRAQAVGLLEKAASSYTDAAAKASAATAQRNDLFRAAYAEAFNTGRISLSRASALRQLGSVHTSSASAFASVFQLQQTLQEAGRELPQSVQEAVGGQPQESYLQAVDAAAKALVEAGETLAGLSSGGSARGPIGEAALTHHAAVVASLWSLHSLVETTGVPVTAEMPSRADLQETARQIADAAQTAGAPLPAAAPFVGPEGISPATAPATEPATQGTNGEAGATQPTEEGAGDAGEGADGTQGGGGEAAGQP